MNIAILGAGSLGTSIAQGILQHKGASRLYLTRRTTAVLKAFEAYAQVRVTSNNREAVRQCTVLVFAVQTGSFAALLEEVAEVITEHHVLISVVAGFSIAKIEQIVGANRCVIRSMPNTAIAVGKSMTCLCGNGLGEKRMALAEGIFNRVGHTLHIPEAHMQAATVICASGVAFWMRLLRATMQGAVQLGFEPREAQVLAVHTCEGAVALLLQPGSHPEVAIDAVTTPKGCTIAGLNAMEYEGGSAALIRGMLASFTALTQVREVGARS